MDVSSGDIVSLLSNVSAIGILAVLVLWLGPRAMRVWQDDQEQSRRQRRSEIDALVQELRVSVAGERTQCQTFVSELIHAQDAWIEKVMTLLSREHELTRQVVEGMGERLDHLQTRVDGGGSVPPSRTP